MKKKITYKNMIRFRSNILLLALILLVLPAKADILPVACAGSVVQYGVDSILEGSELEWQVSGGTIIKYGDLTIDVLWGTENDTFNISVREHSMYDCMSDVSSANVVIKTPFVDLGDVVNVCEGDTGIVVYVGRYSFTWDNKDSINNTYPVSKQGYVGIHIKDKETGCTNEDSVYIAIRKFPKINLGNDTILCQDGFLVLDAGYDALNYEWSTDDISQSINFSGQDVNDTIWVKGTNEYNCTTYDTIVIKACLAYDKFKEGIPLAFTPNGDDHNDYFEIPGKEQFPDMTVEIFDRWGRQVFKSEPGYPEPWDGRYNGDLLPTDSYYYIIDVKKGHKPYGASISIVR